MVWKTSFKTRFRKHRPEAAKRRGVPKNAKFALQTVNIQILWNIHKIQISFNLDPMLLEGRCHNSIMAPHSKQKNAFKFYT